MNNQSNHSGITVIFEAVSTSAVTDSTSTAVDGSYSVNLPPGVYEITFVAPSYQTVFFNQGQPTLLTGNDSLSTVTLLGTPVRYVSGTIHGTLFSDTTYIANGDLTVPSGKTLTIEGGTLVKFEAGYMLSVDGRLLAQGNVLDKVIFTLEAIGPGPQEWEGIVVGNGSEGNELTYCILERAQYPLVVNRKFNMGTPATQQLILSNSIVRHCDIGVQINSNQTVTLTENEFYDFNYGGIAYGGGEVQAWQRSFVTASTTAL